MNFPRVIPCLLLSHDGFVKTRRFEKARYLGDPVNILRIFNAKEVDELVILDISAKERGPNWELLKELASECFMPLCYGGGLTSLKDVEKIFLCGFEKICLNSVIGAKPTLITECAKHFGSQSVVASIDVQKKVWGGYKVRAPGIEKVSPVDLARQVESWGAGEILLQSVDRDGCMNGYDLDLIRLVSSAVSIPVVACGGAGSLKDMVEVVKTAGASAAAAGSYFVFYGKERGVLINTPGWSQIQQAFTQAPVSPSL